MNTKNILLIGRTGSGKSTIANILFNKVNQEGKFIDFQEIFAEGAGSTSQTRTIQEVKVTINSNEYNLIDTIGFGDTDSKLDPHKVLAELKEKLQELAELSQVFFVFKDKFTPEDVQTYKYLYHDVFNNDKEINKFITVVRTRFDNFEDEIECKTDKEGTIGEGGEVGKIISMCRDLIHVNNPPLNIAKKKEANLEERSLSRKKITDHLIKYQGNYEIKLDKKQESKPNSNFSGSTFYGNVYSEISTGDYANFGTIGVKNFGNIQTQQNHSYLNEEVKKNKQKEKLSTSENNSSINVLRSEIPPQSTSAEKNLTTGIAQIINLGNISKKEENNRSFGHQKRVSIMSVSDFEEINAISAEDLPANVYQLTLNFLKAKEYFYLTRQRTVNNLKIQIQELESRIGKLNNIGSVAELVINLGSFTRSLDQGITTAIGKGAKMSSEALSSNYISKQGKQIHLIFQNSEEEKNNLQQLDFAYSQLNNSLQGNKEYDLFGLLDSRHHRAFKVDYKIYDILEHQINI
jgi:GTP-binding protein EngB required for normal cell division